MTQNYHTTDSFLAACQAWGIPLTTHDHEPAFTVEADKLLTAHIPGIHTKNLFLRSRKKAEYILVVMIGEDRLNLKQFTKDLGYSSGDLSFATEDLLLNFLGIKPGHVSPFALINPSSKDVKLILDFDMMQFPILNFHPLINSKTSSITREDFLLFLNKVNHTPNIMRLPKL